MIISKHVQAAPATAFALAEIEGPGVPHDTAAVLLATAALADRALYSGSGYTDHTAQEVATVLDADTEDVLETLTALTLAGLLEPRDRDDETPSFRFPEIAFNRANGGEDA